METKMEMDNTIDINNNKKELSLKSEFEFEMKKMSKLEKVLRDKLQNRRQILVSQCDSIINNIEIKTESTIMYIRKISESVIKNVTEYEKECDESFIKRNYQTVILIFNLILNKNIIFFILFFIL
jgi:hypothetical protein